MYKTNIKYALSFIYLIGFVSYVLGQDRTQPYEYFFQTENVPDVTTVTIKIENTNSPRWDEDYYLASGTETVYRYITGNHNNCPGPPNPYAIDQGGGEYPSIGYANIK